ncbi:ATP-binding protein [Actinomadura sp. 9N215]|uniref:sensor histidine kinase n=1 Tax=Actinomadura sp. 9N215 TaxID=3375150 RepID=UPI0037890182
MKPQSSPVVESGQGRDEGGGVESPGGGERERRRTPAAGGAAGPAESGLRALGRREAAVSRVAVVLGCGLLAIPGAPAPLAAAGLLALALLGCGLYWLSLTRRPAAGWATADLAIVVCVCLTQHWTVSPDLLDGGVSSARAVASLTVVAYQWHSGPRNGAIVAVVVTAAYLAGAAVGDGGAWNALWPKAPWMLVEAALSRILWMLMLRGARHADHIGRREGDRRRRWAVAAAIRADERDYLAALHDTAAATLLMVGLGGARGRALAEQAGRDVRILSGHLEHGGAEADLAEMLGTTIGRSSLTVHQKASGPLPMPLRPAVAICRGVHEALANVARHAGVSEATVSAGRDGDGVRVEVRDRGRGFVPAEVPRHRRGVSMSIVERMAAAGGSGSVTSLPGAGTRVTLTWSPASERAGRATEGVWRTRSAYVTVAGFLRGMRLAVVGIIVALLLVWELPMMASGGGHGPRPFAVQVTAYCVMLAVAIGSGMRIMLHRPIRRPVRWLMLAVVVVASVAASAGTPMEELGGPSHWNYGNVGWFALLLLMDAPLRVLIAATFLDYAVALVLLTVAGESGFGTLAVLTTASVLIWSYHLGVVFATWALRRIAETAARISLEEERLRTRDAVGRRLHGERQSRFAALATAVIPLLTGLASGTLDPADPEVRRDCALEAARLRRLFAESDDVPDPLVHELEAYIDDVERRGVAVSLAVRGRRSTLDPLARRALTEPALWALLMVASAARITVVAAPAEVTVSVVGDVGDAGELARLRSLIERNRAGRVTVSLTTMGTRFWVEATWRDTKRPA